MDGSLKSKIDRARVELATTSLPERFTLRPVELVKMALRSDNPALGDTIRPKLNEMCSMRRIYDATLRTLVRDLHDTLGFPKRNEGESQGQRIKAIRNFFNLTQEELADASGISAVHVNRVERGRMHSKTRPITINAICSALGVDQEERDYIQSLPYKHSNT